MSQYSPQTASELLDRLAQALETDRQGNFRLPEELPLRRHATFILERAESLIKSTLHDEITPAWLVFAADQLAQDCEHLIAAQRLPDVPPLNEVEEMADSEIHAAARRTATLALATGVPFTVGQLSIAFNLSLKNAAALIGEAAQDLD